MFGKKKIDNRHKLTDIEQIVEDYIVCICHFYRGEKPPFVKRFTDGVADWLETDIGEINLGLISSDNAELSERRYEIEALIADNDFSEEEIIEKLNEEIKNQW